MPNSVQGFTAILVCLTLLPCGTLAAAVPVQVNPKLKIVVVEGEGAIHRVGGSARAIEIRVEDENGRPVPGAVVGFQVPPTGASGKFGGESAIDVTSDAMGRATASLEPNAVAGEFEILVTVSTAEESAKAVIVQRNEAAPPPLSPGAPPVRKKGSSKWIVLLAVAAGAVGGGIAAAGGGGGGGGAAPPGGGPPPTATPTPTIRIGTGTVAGP